MSIWGIPFVLTGLYLIADRFLVDAGLRAKTFYGLTDRRAIIMSGPFSRTIHSLLLGTLTDISLQARDAPLDSASPCSATSPCPAFHPSMPWRCFGSHTRR